jgi:WD40 repeat protein
LISGSDDQMIQSWRTSGFTNPLINQNSGMLGNAQKAVRVVRYRPVNNDLVAAGLENGEIQLWRALPGDRQPIHTFANQPDDRVFSLAFSPDSRHLFSGHGSGTVVQWRLDADLARVPTQQREKNVGFAINALGLVGETDRHLAVAGRFNQLTLWDVEKDSLKAIPYDAGSQSDYILSLATASRKPYLLASGDNQGRIKLWNLQPCLTGPAPCQLLDTWTSGPQPSPAVYGLALSADGCYLASAAEDGQVKLWSLNPGGDRWPPRLDGQVLGRTRVASNSVDILRTRDQIRVVSGGDDTLVRFYQVQQSESNCQ